MSLNHYFDLGSFRDIATIPVIVMVIILFILIICYATARRQYKEVNLLIKTFFPKQIRF